jgi:DNA-binding transcriptional ArsR family regulator
MIFGMIAPLPKSSRKIPSRAAALEAVASPVRQEVMSELGEGEATVKELAARLGRSRQALHFHVGVLERAGLVEAGGERGEGREKERVYRRCPGAGDLRARGAGPMSRRERAAAVRAAESMLRVTQREVARAVMGGRIGSGEGRAPAVVMRAKARLDKASLARFEELMKEMASLFRGAKGKNQGARMLALTLVLTPARESKVGGADAGNSRGEEPS